jgi:hypothetical protein
MTSKRDGHAVEIEVREAFNAAFGTRATKQRIMLGGQACHEFDMVDLGIVIGGITMLPWRYKGSNNTAGQDRVGLELHWLDHWNGPERRVLVLTDEEMAIKLPRRFQGLWFRAPLEILHYSTSTKAFSLISTLGAAA